MKVRLFAGGALSVVLAACGGAEPAPGETTTPPAEAPVETPAPEPAGPPQGGAAALWTLADEDTTVHLFGTVHVLKPGTVWRSDAFEAAFDEADTIYFEADVSSPASQSAAAQLITTRGLYTDGRTLTEVLDEDDEREVAEAVAVIGAPLTSYDPMKPWFAGMTMGLQQLISQGYAADSGVEVTLGEEAALAGKEARYLETVEEQIGFFADLPEEDQIDFLVASAVAIEDDPTQLDRLVVEWTEGDVAAIGEMLSDVDAFGTSAVYDTLLTNRNADWVDQITALMEDEEGVFMIAVGAGHLAGPDSVQAMLRAEGYEVNGP
ncbi:MAG: TraB/GumN family protein [Pseudomonadota bacterium]